MIRLIRAEVFKLRTTPGPWVILGINTFLMLMIMLITYHHDTTAPTIHQFGGQTAPPPTVHVTPRLTVSRLHTALTIPVFLALVLAPLIGVLCITGEYRHKVLTTTLLVTPKRPNILIAKSFATMIWGLVLGLASVIVVGLSAIWWASADGGTSSALVHEYLSHLPRVLGTIALLALFGMGIGILVKNQIAGVLLTIGGTLVLETALLALIRHFLNINMNWLPSPAADALANVTATHGTSLLSWWLGGLALLGWGVVPGVVGYFTTFRRDVT